MNLHTHNKTNEPFIHPIEFSTETFPLSTDLVEALELGQDKTPHRNHSNLGTTDTRYLRDTRRLITCMAKSPAENMPPRQLPFTVSSLFEMDHAAFCDKFMYIGPASLLHTFAPSIVETINTHDTLHQLMTVYVLGSPFLSILLPILLFILSATLLCLWTRSPSAICRALPFIASNPLYKFAENVFGSANRLTLQQKIVALAPVILYGVSTYMSIAGSVSMYRQIRDITAHLTQLKHYVAQCRSSMATYLDQASTANVRCSAYVQFISRLQSFIRRLIILDAQLATAIAPTWTRVVQCIGTQKTMFYKIFTEPDVRETLFFSAGFCEYMHDMEHLANQVRTNKLAPVRFLTGPEQRPIINAVGMRYPKYVNSTNTVNHSIRLNATWVITGTNASGKTTLIKSVMLNCILAQQIGLACCATMSMTPFHSFHCYMNIVDTSNTDSLFQAEARAAKKILDAVKADVEHRRRHLCIFDELFSGTNPADAIHGATEYVRHISAQTNAVCLFTTHYTETCERLADVKRVYCKHMALTPDGHPTYQLESGASFTRNGQTIFHQLNYPASFWNGET